MRWQRWAAVGCVLVVVGVLAGVLLSRDGSDDTSKTTITTREATDPNSGHAVRLTYLPDSPYGKKVSEAQLGQSVATLERRAKLLDLDETRVRKHDGKVVVTYAPQDFADPANSQLPVQGRLYFYDYEGNVVGNPDEPIKSIYDVVKQASERKPVDSPDDTTGEQFYLFGALRNYQGGPAGSRRALLERHLGKLPRRAQVLEVPPGTIVVLAHPLTNSLDPTVFDGNFIMRDRPQLDNSGIRNARFVESDDEPGVQFDFTESGRASFQRLTRQVAREGSPDEPHHVAAVLDGAILSKLPVAPDTYPNGLDGRNGAVLSGAIDAEQARDLAAVLDSGPLPFRLIPLLQEQVPSG
ncbi:MAG: hypothetical protein WDZ37_01230 [Solirubrobacterales bacterium]